MFIASTSGYFKDTAQSLDRVLKSEDMNSLSSFWECGVNMAIAFLNIKFFSSSMAFLFLKFFDLMGRDYRVVIKLDFWILFNPYWNGWKGTSVFFWKLRLGFSSLIQSYNTLFKIFIILSCWHEKYLLILCLIICVHFFNIAPE